MAAILGAGTHLGVQADGRQLVAGEAVVHVLPHLVLIQQRLRQDALQEAGGDVGLLPEPFTEGPSHHQAGGREAAPCPVPQPPDGVLGARNEGPILRVYLELDSH